ncbi:hypothetical protein GF324_10185 [bacterium]|nr:hypothetical protein [bacterium]
MMRSGGMGAALVWILMLAVMVLGAADGALASKAFKYNGDDDAEFTKKFISFLEKQDMTIHNQGENWLSVKGESFIIALQPKVSADGLDRIIANIFLTVKSEYKSGSNQKLNDLVWKLNSSLNTAQFALDGDKDLVMLSHITFVDELTFEEMKAFIDWFDQSVLTLMVAAPEALEILE